MCQECRLIPWIRKIPWRRECQPTPVFLPGECHGQRSLVGYSSGVAESWTWLSHTHTNTHTHTKTKKTSTQKTKLKTNSKIGDWNLPVTCASICAKMLQSCLALCDPMDWSPPGSSVHGILQARILEWVAMPSSRESSQPRDQTHVSYVSCIGRRVFYQYCHPGSPTYNINTSDLKN